MFLRESKMRLVCSEALGDAFFAQVEFAPSTSSGLTSKFAQKGHLTPHILGWRKGVILRSIDCF